MIKNDCLITLVTQWRRLYDQKPPTDKTLKQLYEKFMTTGSVEDLPRSGRPSLMKTKLTKSATFSKSSPQTQYVPPQPISKYQERLCEEHCDMLLE